MSQKRKGDDGCSRMYWSGEEERNEMMKLTKVAKSWEFTCSFCFKKFPSAQAMGGHQNAHRSQRLEEKKLFVRDPIAYRKRAFLQAIKADHHHQVNFNNRSWSSCKETSSSSSEGNKINVMMRMRMSAEEEEEDEAEVEVEKGKGACIEFDVGGCGINLDHNLDLTLKL